MSEVERITPEDAVLNSASCLASHLEFLLRKCRMAATQRSILEVALVIATRLFAEIESDCRDTDLSDEERTEIAREIACAWEDLLSILSLCSFEYLTLERQKALELAQEILEDLFKAIKPNSSYDSSVSEFERLLAQMEVDLQS